MIFQQIRAHHTQVKSLLSKSTRLDKVCFDFSNPTSWLNQLSPNKPLGPIPPSISGFRGLFCSSSDIFPFFGSLRLQHAL